MCVNRRLVGYQRYFIHISISSVDVLHPGLIKLLIRPRSNWRIDCIQNDKVYIVITCCRLRKAEYTYLPIRTGTATLNMIVNLTETVS